MTIFVTKEYQMNHQTILDSINREISGNKLITDCKEGDIIVYMGGYAYTSTGRDRKLDSTSFTIGNEYVVKGMNKDGDVGNYKDYKGNKGRGHLWVKADDRGSANGWGAALFIPVEEANRLTDIRI